MNTLIALFVLWACGAYFALILLSITDQQPNAAFCLFWWVILPKWLWRKFLIATGW